MGLSRSIYVLLGIFVVIGSVSAAYAIGIQLGGDVTIDGTLTTGGAITSPTITDLQNQITALPSGGAPPPTNLDVDFLDGIVSSGFAKSSQSCTAGQLVIGFDASGNEICRELRIIPQFNTFPASSFTSGKSMTIGNDGFPILSYVSTTDLIVTHCKNAICSDLEENTVVSGGVSSPATSIVIGNDNLPIIAYVTTPLASLRVVHCTDVSCSGIDTTGIIEGVQTFSPIDMVIGNDGFPIIVITRAFDNNGLRIAHCPDATCTGQATTTELDPGVSVSDTKAIAIGSDGLPIVAYVDDNNEDLKLIHCTNVSCSSSDTPINLDTGAVNSAKVSIAIGSDNFAIISYQENILGNLQVIHCTNVSCSSFGSPVVLDDGGEGAFGSQSVAQWNSMVIGNDGLPLIAYVSESNEGFIRMVKCTSSDCSTFEAPEYVIRDIVDALLILKIGNDGLPVIAYENSFNTLEIAIIGGIGFS